MKIVEVEILVQTITAQYGVLSAGDILRTSPEYAHHLVKDAFAAKYVVAPDDADASKPADPLVAVKPSEGLTVAEIKEALAAKGVDIPEGTTLKADLAALLDSQQGE